MKIFGRLITAVAVSAALAAGLIGCGGDNGAGSGGDGSGGDYDYSLSCGDRPCQTVKIGNQTWMAENLNYKTAESWCYNNSPDSCAKYGRLYTYVSAKKACPSGWHLPTRNEWDALVDYAGGGVTAGGKLKAASGWNDDGNGTDQYGFSALPGGYRYASGDFGHSGRYGGWWTAPEYGNDYARYRHIDYNHSDVYEYGSYDKGAFSARCLQDG